MKTVLNKPQTFGGRLRQARKAAGMNQSDLARKVGVAQSVISDIETNEITDTAHTVKLAMACRVSPVWLQTGIGPSAGEHHDEIGLVDDEEMRLLGMYRNVSPEFRQHIMQSVAQLFDIYSELPKQAKDAFADPGRSDQGVADFATKRRKPKEVGK